MDPAAVVAVAVVPLQDWAVERSYSSEGARRFLVAALGPLLLVRRSWCWASPRGFDARSLGAVRATRQLAYHGSNEPAHKTTETNETTQTTRLIAVVGHHDHTPTDMSTLSQSPIEPLIKIRPSVLVVTSLAPVAVCRG